MVLAEGASCVAFDFAGSGQSDGDYVTLGWNEKNDVAAVVDHIRGRGLVSSVALWGRRWVWGCCHPRRACGAHRLLARGGVCCHTAWVLPRRCYTAIVTHPSPPSSLIPRLRTCDSLPTSVGLPLPLRL